MKIHRLKTWPIHFEEVAYGNKTSEVRLNDRDYQVGDRLILQEYEPVNRQYSGLAVVRDITHILEQHDGLVPGFVSLSICIPAEPEGTCVICGCTDENCSQCIEKTGAACAWLDHEEMICSACAFEDQEGKEVVCV